MAWQSSAGAPLRWCSFKAPGSGMRAEPSFEVTVVEFWGGGCYGVIWGVPVSLCTAAGADGLVMVCPSMTLALG
jgi:hypothetical protein